VVGGIVKLNETLALARRLAESDYEAALSFGRFMETSIDAVPLARAAEFALTTYQSLLLGAFALESSDGQMDFPFGPDATAVLDEHADREFVCGLFGKLAIGSSQWQVWASPEQWDEWFTRSELA
jgi:hypothetical protein